MVWIPLKKEQREESVFCWKSSWNKKNVETKEDKEIDVHVTVIALQKVWKAQNGMQLKRGQYMRQPSPPKSLKK